MALPNPQKRFAYIDWLRGLACLMMFIVHGYDSWLKPALREGGVYKWTQFMGSIPAPIFLFLAGVSLAVLMDKRQRGGVSENQIALGAIRRGLEILACGYLFRLQEYVLGLPKSPWTDLLRVDILNTIGLSIAFMGAVYWLARTRARIVIVSVVLAAAMALATPPLYTTWRPRWLPWYLESYINGVHIYDSPRAWLFPIFPWTGFAFAGLALGFVLFSEWGRARAWSLILWTGAAGVATLGASLWLEAHGPTLYATHDYWHTSPNFFLARLGVMMAMMPVGYAWCQWGAGERGFSPLIQMGRTSLLVYWVHIIFVYGRLSILRKGRQDVPMATLGIVVVTVAMVLLSIASDTWEKPGPERWAWFHGKLGRSPFSASIQRPVRKTPVVPAPQTSPVA
jgi:uncharacterized membrane protein